MGGGWLVSADIAGLGWRNAFFINVPICLLVLAFSRRYVPETRRESHSSIDWQGNFQPGVNPLQPCCFRWRWGRNCTGHGSYSCFLLAVLPLLGWMRLSALRKQQRGEQPLLPPRLLKLTSIRFGMAIALLFFSARSGFMFLYGADHAGRAGDGAVAVRQQFYRSRGGLFYLRAVRAKAYRSLQHGTDFC